MSTLDELRLLTSQMKLEPAEDSGCRQITDRKQDSIEVFNAQLPNGKTISLLKTLLTSVCEHNCNYCFARTGRDIRRGTLKPDEMAQVFNAVHRAGIVQGIFLSSGIAGGGIRTQDRIIATAEILRSKYDFQGYIHLKLMPGSEKDQVERTMRLADRVSLNLEAPNSNRLEMLAPEKIFETELLQTLKWVDEIRRTTPPHLGWRGRWPSMTTQFVVGAVGESDLELLTTTSYMHKNLHLGRAYFSSFEPTPNTPFENYPAASTIREHRLYQASFLLRDYCYDIEELPFMLNGNLPENIDPKLAWANKYLQHNPVEINRAERGDLLKIPGIGPKSAEKILKARRQGMLRRLEDLHKIGVNSLRAAPFILLDGRQPAYQLSFW